MRFPNNLSLIKGFSGTHHSYATNPTSPAMPTHSGTSVLHESQSNITPPHVTGINTAVTLPTNTTLPTQSTRASFCAKLSVLWFKFRYSGINTNPSAQNGRFNQKIHRQFASCAKAPPMMGPDTDPMAHIIDRKPKYFPRSRNGTKSVTMISVRAMIPPPPIPWIERPTRITVKLSATLATMAPAVKKTNATRISALRPKMSEREAKLGWKTVDVRRKDVPDQKASIALPWSFSEMI